MTGPKPYLEITEDSYASFAAEHFKVEELKPETLVLRGPCPRCGGVMEAPVVDSIFRSMRGIRFWRRQSPPAAAKSHVEPMMCDCSEDHPDRPDGRSGCGAYWTLTISVADQ
ncbi:hypothetical protein AB0K27_20935 [Micromonospora echinospora]|uniref:hypothetical protein n=1 Tax=Micromonospora echinospora TaxID=1877 RepID=UPI00343618EF